MVFTITTPDDKLATNSNQEYPGIREESKYSRLYLEQALMSKSCWCRSCYSQKIVRKTSCPYLLEEKKLEPSLSILQWEWLWGIGRENITILNSTSSFREWVINTKEPTEICTSVALQTTIYDKPRPSWGKAAEPGFAQFGRPFGEPNLNTQMISF